MTRLQELAALARTFFEPKQRDGDTIWMRKDPCPDWVADLVTEAHEGMFPDDWRYSFIVEALDALAEHDEVDDARDSIEADLYTGQLLSWLDGWTARVGYVEEAWKEFDRPDTFIGELQLGQLVEKREVFELVKDFLEQKEGEGDEI